MINNSLHLVQNFAWIFVCGHYLFREVNSILRAKLEETGSFEEQIMSKDKYQSIFFEVKWRLLCLLSRLKYFSQHMAFEIWDIPLF